jgi:hypothetical protein
MCGTAVDIESVVAHTKKCDASRLNSNGHQDANRARSMMSTHWRWIDFLLFLFVDFLDSITQIHKKPLRSTELSKLNMLTQLVTDVVAIRSAGILGIVSFLFLFLVLVLFFSLERFGL